MKVEYHPGTIIDLNRAIDFYEQRRIGLGGELRNEIIRRLPVSPRILLFPDPLQDR